MNPAQDHPPSRPAGRTGIRGIRFRVRRDGRTSLMARQFCLYFLRNNLLASACLCLFAARPDIVRLDLGEYAAAVHPVLLTLAFSLASLGPLAAWLVFSRFQRHTIHLWYNLGFTRLKLFFLGLGVSWIACAVVVLTLALGWPHG